MTPRSRGALQPDPATRCATPRGGDGWTRRRAAEAPRSRGVGTRGPASRPRSASASSSASSRAPMAGRARRRLGLAIVRDIVQAHGGRIHLDSEVGGGSRFTLELPHERCEHVRAATMATVLIVDDDPSIREALATSRRRAGIGLATRGRGAALACARPSRTLDLLDRLPWRRWIGARPAQEGRSRPTRGRPDHRLRHRRDGRRGDAPRAPTTTSPKPFEPDERRARGRPRARALRSCARETASCATRSARAGDARSARAGHARARRRWRASAAAHRRDGADPRRERHGQGARGARDPRARAPRAAARSCAVNCARPPRDAARERAVRPREGRLHRRRTRQARASSSGPTAARSSSTRSASMPPALQAKLLRVLQERDVRARRRHRDDSPSTCASSPPPTATWRTRGRGRHASARTSTTAST